MREVPSTKPYPRKETPVRERKSIDDQRKEKAEAIKERITVKSLLTDLNGTQADIKVAIMQDACARQINFWDLDKTLLKAEPIHKKAIQKMFPEAAEADTDELMKTFVAGWRLGNSYREWDRMHRIYAEGQIQYKDQKVYEKEFIDNKENCAKLDSPGHEERWHERAAEMLQRYDVEACIQADLLFAPKTAEEEARGSDRKPLTREEILIDPIVHLLQVKVRRGELNVFMTANPRAFAERLVKYSGLTQYGFALATDESVVGGGKEVGIAYLMDHIKEAGIGIPTDRLVAIGDSIGGDVGAGYKFMKKNGNQFTFQGVLIQKDSDEDKRFKADLAESPNLQKMFADMEVTVITSDNVRQVNGHYKLGRMGSVVREKNPQEKSAS